MEDLIAIWDDYAEQYASVDDETAARFRRLATQLRDILETSPPSRIKTINVREPGVPPPAEPRRKRIAK
jgi:hypothetical protein